MKRFTRCLTAIVLSVTAMIHGLSLPLSAQEAPTKEGAAKGSYVDDKYDFSLQVSDAWKSMPLQGLAVPGVPRVAFTRPAEASIVVFMQEPGQAFDPRFLLDQSVTGVEKGLAATAKEKEVRSVAGMKAMWMVVEGPGTGAALDGKGPVKTTQHWVAIPREKDIVVVLLTSPSDKFAENRKLFEEVLESLKVGGKQTATQSESK
jgi:hypothetical protein